MSTRLHIRQAFGAGQGLGDNPRAKWLDIAGMNHILKAVEQTDRTAQLASYTDPALPLHPKLVGEVAAFLKTALGAK